MDLLKVYVKVLIYNKGVGKRIWHLFLTFMCGEDEDNGRIITAEFMPAGSKCVTAKNILWKYDHGVTLRLLGLKLPTAVKIHFSAHSRDGKSETRVGVTTDGVTDVTIPNALLELNRSPDYSIYAFMYFENAESGYTEYKISMTVRSRPASGEEQPDTEQDHPLADAVHAVNDAADRTESGGQCAIFLFWKGKVMNFQKAYEALKQGAMIKCPEWAGYWKWEDNSIKMHCKDGRILDIRETENVDYTLNFILRDDWEVVGEADVKDLDIQTFTFGEAIRRLKAGQKVARKGWNSKKQYIQLATGISYVSADGELVNCEHDAIGNKAIAFVGTSGVQMGWLALQADMLAEDWIVAE